MNLLIITRKIENKWEGAILSGGNFSRAIIGEDLYALVHHPLIAALASDQPEGTELHIEVRVIEKDKTNVNK